MMLIISPYNKGCPSAILSVREIQRGRDLHEEAVDQVLRDVYRKRQMDEQEKNVQAMLSVGGVNMEG